MLLRTLIVDDEYPARQELRFLLSKFENIDIVGEATTVNEAFTLIKSLEYHIVFLDINFPKSNGIDLGALIKKLANPPLIIYVTAYDTFAVKAFDINAIDYILKPIDKMKLRRAIDRVLKVYGNQENLLMNNDQTKTVLNNSSEGEEIDRLIAEYNGKTVLVNVNDIYYAISEDNYVFIKLHDKKLITRFTLASLEKRMNKKIFFRTHRSYLVNLKKVDEISPLFKGTCELVMNDKERNLIPVSRRQLKQLKELLGF